MKLQMEGTSSMRGHLKSAQGAFMEVYATWDGIKQPPIVCATTTLEEDTVKIINADIIHG